MIEYQAQNSKNVTCTTDRISITTDRKSNTTDPIEHTDDRIETHLIEKKNVKRVE